jgi:hypothetical protein
MGGEGGLGPPGAVELYKMRDKYVCHLSALVFGAFATKCCEMARKFAPHVCTSVCPHVTILEPFKEFP